MPVEEYGARFTARDETKKAATSASRSVASVAAAYAKLAVGAAVAFRGIQAGSRWVKESIKLSAVQQDAQVKLDAALRNIGDTSTETRDRLQAYASELQGLTVVGDETTLKNMALALSMGAPVESLEDLSAALAGAEAAGIPAQTMMRGLAASFSGSAGMLSRYVPAVRDLTEEQLRAGEAVKLVKDQFFALAEAQRQTFSGSIQALQNAWGDYRETIGSVVTESPVLRAALLEITDRIVGQTDAINEQKSAYIDFVDDGVYFLADAYGVLVFAFGEARSQGLLFMSALSAIETAILGAAQTGTRAWVLYGRAWAATVGRVTGLGDEVLTTLNNIDAASRAMLNESKEGMVDYVDQWAASKEQTLESLAAIDEFKRDVGALAEEIRSAGDSTETTGGGLSDLGKKADEAKSQIAGLDAEMVILGRTMDQAVVLAAEAVADAAVQLDHATDDLASTGIAAAISAYQDLIDSGDIATMSLTDLWAVVEQFDPAVLLEFQAEWAVAMESLVMGTDGAGDSLRALIGQMQDAQVEMQAIGYDAKTLTDVVMEHSHAWEDLGGVVGGIVMDSMVQNVRSGFGAIGDLIKTQIGQISEGETAWESFLMVVVDVLVDIVSAVIAAALAQGIANAVAAGSGAASNEKTVQGAIAAFATVAGAIIAGVIAAVATAESEGNAIHAAEGGMAMGGVRGVDSIAATVQQGELIMPPDVSEAFLGVMQIARERYATPVSREYSEVPMLRGGRDPGERDGGRMSSAGSLAVHIGAPWFPEDQTSFERRVEPTLRRLVREMKAQGLI